MRHRESDVITRTFWRLLPLQMIIVTIGSINAIIDGTVASNAIGPQALTIIGLFFPIGKLMDTVSAMMLGGSQILCGQYIGKNNPKRAREIFSIDVFVNVIFGLLLGVLCAAFPRAIGALLTSDASFHEALGDYLRGYAPGIVAFLLTGQFTAFLQIENKEKLTYIGMAVMIVANTLLDIVFVSRLGMGLFGLGLATSIANFLYLIVLASHFVSKRASFVFSLSSVRLSDLPEIIRIGVPGALMQVAQAVRAVVLNAIMLRYAGQNGVAAFAAVMSFGGVFYATYAGIASASRLLVSVYAGEEDRAGVREIMKLAMTWGLGMVFAISLLLMTINGALTALYYGPEAGEVYGMTRAGFAIYPLSMALSCICCVYIGYYQCMAHLKAAAALSVNDGILGTVLLSFLLAPALGMVGIWWAHVFSGMLSALIVVGYTVLRSGKIPGQIEDTLLLPGEFGVSETDRIDISVFSMEEVLRISERVIDFCHAHGVDSRRSMASGLVVEELAGNIVSHGFGDGKRHAVDIRVVYDRGELLIRLKDDCRSFNPTEYYELFNPADVTHNIGIRLVGKLSKGMKYQNNLGLNVLTIQI